MTKKLSSSLVPDQQSGVPIRAQHSVTAPDNVRAHQVFTVARARLLQVNEWTKVAGAGSADFAVYDDQAHATKRAVRKGDYLRVDIPGPGPSSGHGYDWVHVEDMEERQVADEELIAFRVRPSSNPASPDDAVAHFYSPESTSTFIVARHGLEVSATIYDSNTKVNDTDAGIGDRIRNTMVGAGGIAAFSKWQWKKLAEGLLR